MLGLIALGSKLERIFNFDNDVDRDLTIGLVRMFFVSLTPMKEQLY